MTLFDAHRHHLHIKRAAPLFQEHRFLYDDVSRDLIDRLQDIKRNFNKVLNLSPYPLNFEERQVGVIENSPPLALPFPAECKDFDLIISCLALHWAEDPVGLLTQIRKTLKPDGLFLATFYGGDTLHELRTALMEAELQLTGGASPRTAPMTRIEDGAMLLQRTGFALPVLDTDDITITYPSLRALVKDLRGMGETNKMTEQSSTPRKLFDAAEAIYKDRFALEDGTLPVTVQLLTLTGWAPSQKQQQPLRPGSATARLADALGEDERTV